MLLMLLSSFIEESALSGTVVSASLPELGSKARNEFVACVAECDTSGKGGVVGGQQLDEAGNRQPWYGSAGMCAARSSMKAAPVLLHHTSNKTLRTSAKPSTNPSMLQFVLDKLELGFKLISV
jgi:hypothetical protein